MIRDCCARQETSSGCSRTGCPYEALDALESGDEQAFCKELGDVLLQVVFHARVAAERADGYTINDVTDGIVAKLARWRRHVFAGVTVSGAEEVYRNWDEIKPEEKNERAERAGVPGELTRLGDDPGVAGPAGSGEDIGRELLRLVAKIREAGHYPEVELRAAARRYRDLVRAWEPSRQPAGCR